MAKQVINIGAAPNDGTGTPLRTSFDYTNQNFTELYNGSGIGTSTNTQVLFNDSGVANGDAGMVYNKTTDALTVGGAFTATSGDISASNGSLNSNGASASVRITRTTGDLYEMVASKQTAGNVTSITVVFTVSNPSGETVLVDAQLVGYQAFADFCLGKYASQATQVLRTNASAGITATLVESSGIHTFTITIGSPISNFELPLLNLKVSVGGGFTVSPTFTVLPVVTFI